MAFTIYYTSHNIVYYVVYDNGYVYWISVNKKRAKYRFPSKIQHFYSTTAADRYQKRGRNHTMSDGTKYLNSEENISY